MFLLGFSAFILPEQAAQRQRFAVAFEEKRVNFRLQFLFYQAFRLNERFAIALLSKIRYNQKENDEREVIP